MSIHYENYKAFSRGQGFVGSACRPLGGPMATTLRWYACDCPKCKLTLLGRKVTGPHGDAVIEEVYPDRVIVRWADRTDLHVVMFKDLDTKWEAIP